MWKLLTALFIGSTAVAQVTELNRTQYLGRWYQAYSDFAVEATFENNSYCLTADYGLYPNNTISVLNRERQYNISGPERRVLGWADLANASEPGELTVHLQRLLNSSSVVNSTYASRLCILAAMETLFRTNREVIPDKLLDTIFSKLEEGCIFHNNPPDLDKYIKNAKIVLQYKK